MAHHNTPRACGVLTPAWHTLDGGRIIRDVRTGIPKKPRRAPGRERTAGQPRVARSDTDTDIESAGNMDVPLVYLQMFEVTSTDIHRYV